MTSPIWWHRRGETWRMPAGLTDVDRDWAGWHMELAGWRCDDPPPNTFAAVCVNLYHLREALAGRS